MNAIELAAIRQMFPDDDLYYIKILDDEFVIRAISPKEYATILDIAVTEYDQEDLLCQVAIVYPQGYNVLNGPAGVPKTLAPFVKQLSLLGDEYKAHRAALGQRYIDNIFNNVEAQIPVIIKTAFPEFTFEQIEDWTTDKILKMFARAIWALQLRGIDMSAYNIQYTPEEPKSFKEREQEIREQGGDPVLALYEEYRPNRNVVDFPLIIGKNWRNQEVINALHEQLRRQKKAATR